MGTPFKEGLGSPAITRIAERVAAECASFDPRAFRRDAVRGLDALELKARVVHVAGALRTHLPEPVPAALAVLEKVAARWQHANAEDPLRGFAAWPLIDFVGLHGIEHFDRSMEALPRLTHLFSAEFAIRPFLDRDPERALAVVRTWLTHPDAHVRRLASEGTRPRLPWGMRLRAFVSDPQHTLPLLEALRDDESEYVRRSVANHLNDIAKDHPEVVASVAARWAQGASKERAWIVRHATRTLVKQGHAGALALHGVAASAAIDAAKLTVSPKRVAVGEALTFRVALTSRETAAAGVVVDYAIHHVKADGTTRPKVFKGQKLTLAPGERRVVGKTHTFARVTVRRYYAGPHELEVLVNGRSVGKVGFTLTDG